MARTVRDIMTEQVITIAPDALLSDAFHCFRTRRISMLVVEQQGRAVGLLTERDAVRFVHDKLDLGHTRVASVMTAPVTTVSASLSLFEAYSILTENHFRHLVVADADGMLAGVVTLTDMLDGMGLEYFVDLKQIASIMSRKLTRVRPDDALRLAIDLMYRHRISCIVVEERWRPVGIITERDIVRYCDGGAPVDGVAVRAVMSSPVRTMSDSCYVPEANKVMREERLRHMVIVDHQGRLAGLISQTDLTSCMEAGYVAYLKRVIEEREKQLDEVSHRHAAFLRDNPNAVIAFDAEGGITDANLAALKLTGYDRAALLRSNFRQLIHARDAERAQQLIEQISHGDSAHAELQMRCPSGLVVDLFTSFLPISSNGQVRTIYAVMHDITEQKQAERRLHQSEQRFQALVELSHAMPWSLDMRSGCFSYVGRQIERDLGYPADSWVNMATWAARIHAEDRAAVLHRCAAAAESGSEDQFRCRMIASDGREVPVQVHISVLMQADGALEMRGFMYALLATERAELPA